MKKFIMMVTVIMCIGILFGCSNANKDDSSEKSNKNNYEADYESLYNDLKDMNERTDFNTSIVYSLWSAAPSVIKYNLEDFIEGDLYSLADDHLVDAFGTSDKDTIKQYSDTFNTNTEAITNYISSVKEDVKKFKDNYSKEHNDAAEAFVEWYKTSELYAEMAVSPTGSLNSYSSDMSKYKDELNKNINDIEFAK